MTTSATPLRDVFYPDGRGIPGQVMSRVAPMPSLAAAFPNFTSTLLGDVQKDVKTSADKMLEMTPIQILIEGWKKYGEVKKALEDSLKKPADPILKPLVKHTVKSVHHPYVELLVDGAAVKKYEFELTASLEVEGVTLRILAGQITQVMSGTCVGKFQLAHNKQTLIEKKTGKINLPGVIRLKPEPAKPADAKPAAPRETPVTMARLNGLSGEVAGKIYRLTDGLVIGRSSSSSIHLSEPTVSRHHARVRQAGSHWFIQDMESAIGIYVNGVKVEASALKNGDLIRVGKNEFEFHDEP